MSAMCQVVKAFQCGIYERPDSHHIFTEGVYVFWFPFPGELLSIKLLSTHPAGLAKLALKTDK